MCIVRALRSLVFLSVFASISFFLFAYPAFGDGVMVTMDTTSLTIFEGDTFTIDATVTNNSSSVISLIGSGAGGGLLGGDPTDNPFTLLAAFGSCGTDNGLTTLDPGSSCVLSRPYTAAADSDTLPEDNDAGIWILHTGVQYTCDVCAGQLEADSADKVITVEDRPSSSVGEPSILLLLFTGLFGGLVYARMLVTSARKGLSVP